MCVCVCINTKVYIFIETPAKEQFVQEIITPTEEITRVHTWMIAVIVVACVVVIVAACAIIWFYKKMQKNNNSRILSQPDAKMIADTFRQVMSNKDQVGEDLLKRQLAAEGTSVLHQNKLTSVLK